MVKPLKMNADYEMNLFLGKPGPQIINHSLEFLLFFLEDRPVFTTKQYSPEYFEYVEAVTKLKPQIVAKGNFENFWGLQKNLDVERWWNSKLTTTEFQIERGWDAHTKIVSSRFNANELDPELDYLIKDPYGMSGQSFQIISRDLSLPDKEKKISQMVKNGILIAEPLYDRVYDFSHYIYPDQTEVAYQNRVDAKFQYKGSLFSNIHFPQIKYLDFFDKISREECAQFEIQKNALVSFLSQRPNEIGYSIDSFVYRHQGDLKIRSISEINYRRTMGRIAFELGQKYGKQHSRVEFSLMKTSQDNGPLWKRIEDHNKFLVLSPGDTRFEMILIFSDSLEQGQQRYQELVDLVANGQFSV